VRFTTAEEDARRRDFTINGLFFDPVENRVIDFVGGQTDLHDRVLRAIGDPEARFSEDYLRMLRAVRFAARFGLTIEPATRGAIVANAHKLPRISPERIADELRRMLVPATRGVAWWHLAELRLLSQVFRHLPDAPLDGSFDPATSLVLRLPDDRAVSFGLVLAAGVLEIALQRRQTNDIRAIVEPRSLSRIDSALRRMLRYSNDESESVKGILDLGTLLQDARPTVAMLKRFLARATSGDARLLLSVLRDRGLHVERIDWLLARFEELSREEIAPPPLITGDDLIAAGWQPGRLFKRVLDEVYDAQLESRIRTRDEAMGMASALAEEKRPT
jgi:poly(A) polymerase